MDDLISRQSAIANAISGRTREIDGEKWIRVSEVRESIKTLPSAEPKTGKWIWDENGMDWGLGAWCCSECGSRPGTWWESDKRYHPLKCAGGRFCGNCGAKMEVE